MIFRQTPALLLSMFALLFMSACDNKNSDKTSHDESAHWGYSGESGPAHWADLDPSFSVCGTGTVQSPINITNASTADLANPVLHYEATPIHVINNGHTIEQEYEEGSYMTLDGKRFDLLQFHFHSPSENTVDGAPFAIEMHLVHKSADGALAVIAVFIREGAQNNHFDPVWSHMPTEEATITAEGSVSAEDLLPVSQTTYRFPGSLTTPPCTEGVEWIAMTTPVEMSASQISSFRAVYNGNNRPVQELNGRTLQIDTTP